MGLARRAFLIGSAGVAGALIVGWRWAAGEWDNPLTSTLSADEAALTPYVKISTDGTVTAIVPYAEMGQGVSTTLAALVAEELDIALTDLAVEHGPASGAYGNRAVMADISPYTSQTAPVLSTIWNSVAGLVSPMIGLQLTGSSTSTRDAFDRMREAAATARALLVEAAALEFNVATAALVTSGGRVIHQGSGRSKSYGELALAATKLPLPERVTLKPREEWVTLGKRQLRKDGLSKVTGTAVFGIDVDLPDMLHGTVVMAPRFGARPGTIHDEKAKAIKGFQKLIPIDTAFSHGVAVIADHTWAAFQAAEALEIEWLAEGEPADDSTLAALLDEGLKTGKGWTLANWSLAKTGDATAALDASTSRNLLTLDYAVPPLAHATMEPMNATAQFKDGKLDIWGPIQAPSLVQLIAGNVLDIAFSDITIHVTQLGGGFGRRAEVDFAVFAALAAQGTGGRPVQLTWRRAEDFTHDAYRPPVRARIRALPGEDGLPEALEIKLAAPSVTRSIAARILPSLPMAGPDAYLAEGTFDVAYRFKSYNAEAVDVPLPMPSGYWRSVGYSHNTFFMESALDEIAARVSADRLKQRLALLEGNLAAQGVLARAAELAGWNTPPEDNTKASAQGLAYCAAYDSHVAMIVEVSGSAEAITIERIIVVADVGIALDPGLVADQLVSATIMGLSAAKNEKITLSGGAVMQSNYDTYNILRISACPPILTDVLQTGNRPGGVGELATPVVAPALANAIFKLTGTRIRTLPLSDSIRFS